MPQPVTLKKLKLNGSVCGDGVAGLGCLQKERLDQESGGMLYVQQGGAEL